MFLITICLYILLLHSPNFYNVTWKGWCVYCGYYSSPLRYFENCSHTAIYSLRVWAYYISGSRTILKLWTIGINIPAWSWSKTLPFLYLLPSAVTTVYRITDITKCQHQGFSWWFDTPEKFFFKKRFILKDTRSLLVHRIKLVLFQAQKISLVNYRFEKVNF